MQCYGHSPLRADRRRRQVVLGEQRDTGMGFFNGRVTFLRFAVGGEAPKLFDDEQLDKLREHVAGRQTLETSDGIEAGWSGGKSVLDTNFDLAKNIINDTLHFDFRVDTDRLPGDLLKAYYEADLAALIKENKSGFASSKQKREAKESAHNRLKAEARDGRFRRRKCTPVLWDRSANEVLFGASSTSQVDKFAELFPTHQSGSCRMEDVFTFAQLDPSAINGVARRRDDSGCTDRRVGQFEP